LDILSYIHVTDKPRLEDNLVILAGHIQNLEDFRR